MTARIGTIAAILTTVSFLPQAVKVILTHQTRDLSLITLVILVTGLSCWVIYGIRLREKPIIFANIITLLINLAILTMKIRYG